MVTELQIWGQSDARRGPSRTAGRSALLQVGPRPTLPFGFPEHTWLLWASVSLLVKHR